MPDSQVVDTRRLQVLNQKSVVQGQYVLYWMQQSQRVLDNHALGYAIETANRLDLPVRVVFGLTKNYPDANLRHYAFMLEGLQEVQQQLLDRGISFLVQLGEPVDVALRAARQATMIVCDRGYLRHQKTWRQQLAEQAKCRVVQVESDVIVPIESVSQKSEYAARTIRPKIKKQLATFLLPLEPMAAKQSDDEFHDRGLDLTDVDALLDHLDVDRNVKPVPNHFRGGTSEALKHFQTFMNQRLSSYDAHSNQPQTDDVSGMSPYLHFGQISPLTLALKITALDPVKYGAENIDGFLEQLIVRRELAVNFVHYTPHYDNYAVIPGWAAKTLETHSNDPREYLYSRKELDAAQTHDPYWNAAMLEMKYTGSMHNYMRMYWGKKILEWSRTPQEAYQTTIWLNNRYFLDGRDPNSYTGVAWIYGVHDRAWAERPIFGKVRYMAASGLERKCDIRAYVRKVEKFVGEAKGPS